MAVLDQTRRQEYEKVATDVDAPETRREDATPEPYGLGVRHIQSILIFASLTFIYIIRAQLSVTIVAMTDGPRYQTANEISNRNYSSINFTDIGNNKAMNITEDEIVACFDNSDLTTTNNQTNYVQFNESELCKEIKKNINTHDVIENEEDQSSWNIYRVYPWPKANQEVVLGAFFLGYLIMTTPMGMVCQRWGGKLPLQISLMVSGVVTFFTPWIAVLGGYKAVAASRVIVGLAQAGTYPSIHTLVAKWVPLSERGRLGTYIYTGSMIGSVLAYHISGILAASSLGWPAIYWVTGVLCLIMGILITVFSSPTPAHHRSISIAEKKFILGASYDHVKIRQPTPWKAIFTSKPVIATIVTHFGTSSNFLLFFAQVPTYLHYIVGLNIKNSGLLSSLPYFTNFLMSILMGNLADYFINKKILSCKAVRIISNSIANIGPAICFLTLSFITSPTLAVFCLIVCMGTHAGSHTGWMVNYIDLAPNYSGTLMATGNTIMNVGALILPAIVSNVVTDVTNVYQWRIVLFMVAILSLLCNTVFMFFMSADVQPWNDVTETSELKEVNKEHEQNKPTAKANAA